MRFLLLYQRAAFACVIMCAIVTAGSLHALIPHSHGGDHTHEGRHESAMWTDLHSVLNHEGKKLFLIISVVVTIIFAVILEDRARLVRANSLTEIFVDRLRDPNKGSALRRGILRYRAFG